MLLSAVVLTLSGCGWAVVNWDSFGRHITVKKGVSDNMIFGCTANHGTGLSRTHCALDTVRELCRGAQLANFSWAECVDATTHNDLNERRMGDAILEQIGAVPGLDGDCLMYTIIGPQNESYWTGHTKLGERSCR